MSRHLRTSFDDLTRPLRASSRWRRIAAIATLALLGGFLGLHQLSSAASDRAAFGELRRVPVTRVDLAVGTTIAANQFEWRDLPTAVIPRGVVDRPEGRVVLQPILAGEVISTRRLAGPRANGLAAITPRGARAITVAREATTPAVRPGEHVDLYGPEPRTTAGGRVSRIAHDAVVLELDDSSVTLAVRDVEAADSARAALDGAVIVAVIGPG